jgi:hypothetical protein
MKYNFEERLKELFPNYEYKDKLSPYQMVVKNKAIGIKYYKELRMLNDEYVNTPQPTLSTLWLSELSFSYGYMMGKRDQRQDIIKRCEKINPIYNGQSQWLKELEKTAFTENMNYIRVIRSIPTYFNTNDIYACMMLAFNFGEQRGRECERDLIKWNALATFYNMKSYAYTHDGKLPETFNDLKEWEKERKKYHEQLAERDGDHV